MAYMYRHVYGKTPQYELPTVFRYMHLSWGGKRIENHIFALNGLNKLNNVFCNAQIIRAKEWIVPVQQSQDTVLSTDRGKGEAPCSYVPVKSD